MRNMVCIASLLVVLTGCTAGSMSYRSSPALEPIPGSITYGGQPRTRLSKSPVGSLVQHEFRNEFGYLTHETYVVEPDRSLRLTSRRVIRSFWGGDDP